MINTQYLTKSGYEEVEKELREIVDIKIPEIASKIDEAKQQGDLSENAEYHQAKEEMAWAQGRMLELRHVLDHAEILEKTINKAGFVVVGSEITIKNNDKLKKYTIVGPHEADPLSGKISNESPLGASFLGRKAGENVEIETPAGKQTYQILDIV
ncbi:MAG: transcription elongation factor GreA [Patescibacteria group bacterium]